MKKIFKIILICLFTSFSFYYTDKFISLSKEKDPIMIKIKEKSKVQKEPVEAIITSDVMLVGSSGKKIDLEKSYEKMKKLGKFSNALIEYINISPSYKKENYLDKYLKGKNTKEKIISFIFRLDNFDNLDKTIYILEKNKIKATFFIDGKLIENNFENLKEKLNGQTIGYYGYDNNYSETSLRYINFLLDKKFDISKYCLYKNNTFLKSCEKMGINTIKPIVIENNLYSYMKQNKKNGYIYEIVLNDFNIKQMNATFIYLKQKGYNIYEIDELLKE